MLEGKKTHDKLGKKSRSNRLIYERHFRQQLQMKASEKTKGMWR